MIVGLICQPANRVVIEVCASSRLRPFPSGVVLDDFALDFEHDPIRLCDRYKVAEA